MSENKQEKVIQTAAQVFQRYGFRRVTMNDLAEAAQMSRPALYLVYPSKEEIFKAVMGRFFEEKYARLREGLSEYQTPEKQLIFAFEVWCVQSYEMILTSPDAKDLLESSYEFASEITKRRFAEFVDIVAEILEPLVREQSDLKLTSHQIARVMVDAAPGFKTTAANAAQLRDAIAQLIQIVLASLTAGDQSLA